jgi:hypothetical protein
MNEKVEAPSSKDTSIQADTSDLQSELQVWLAWLKDATALSGDMLQLLLLEIRLALGNVRRLMLLLLLIWPVLIMAWAGFSVLLSWLAFDSTQSISLGLVVFILIQLVALVAMFQAYRVYRKSLFLPVTCKNIKALMDGRQSEA